MILLAHLTQQKRELVILKVSQKASLKVKKQKSQEGAHTQLMSSKKQKNKYLKR
jgi:hypothetical protein